MAATASNVSAVGTYAFSGIDISATHNIIVTISGSGTWSDTGSATGTLKWKSERAGPSPFGPLGSFTCEISSSRLSNVGGGDALFLGGTVTISTIFFIAPGEGCTISIAEGPTLSTGTMPIEIGGPQSGTITFSASCHLKVQRS